MYLKVILILKCIYYWKYKYKNLFKIINDSKKTMKRKIIKN